MRTLALILVVAPLVPAAIAYLMYPAALALLSLVRRGRPQPPAPSEWPAISITVPSYNEAASIRETLDRILGLEYPADRRQVVVISDASTDGTDDIVREYAPRSVELLRLPERRGKTAAENAAASVVRGEIIVNVDATARLHSHSLKALIRAFQDSTVGVASARNVSVGTRAAETTRGESGYVGFEMWMRSLETRHGSIVGASGCFYGIRHELYDAHFPEQLSRDFASALVAREHGLRAVLVDDAVCEVPRAASLGAELRRKTRTMSRGLQTLWYKRHLLNPLRHGTFALSLICHKLCRWLVYPLLPGMIVGLVMLSRESRLAGALLALGIVATLLGVVAMRWQGQRLPAVLTVPGYAVAANLAGIVAWKNVLRRKHNPIWEPTRRTPRAVAIQARPFREQATSRRL